MNHLYKESCESFTELLASSLPVPGGGGASALVASIGIALGDMVGELTLGKKKYADVEGEIKILMEKAQDLRKEFLQCIDEDAQAFDPLSRAYGIAKDDPKRDSILERCLHDAAEPPMKIFDLSCQSIEILKQFAEKGSRMVLSDAATGIAFAKAAMLGAAINVRVNTRLMNDRDHAEALDKQIEEGLSRYSKEADEVYGSVFDQLAYQKNK